MMHKIKVIIFLGAPGSGKGTQAKKIASKFGYKHISTGDLLRGLGKKENLTSEEVEALEIIKNGNLAPDGIIYKLAFSEIKDSLNAGKGVVLDGAIRNLEQAKKFQKFFEQMNVDGEVVAVEIAISDEESFKRLSGRRVCEKCGEIFNIKLNPEPVCVKCGGKLITRADDSDEVVKERILVQGNNSFASIREYYQELGTLIIIDGMKNISEVELAIENELKNLYALQNS